MNLRMGGTHGLVVAIGAKVCADDRERKTKRERKKEREEKRRERECVRENPRLVAHSIATRNKNAQLDHIINEATTIQQFRGLNIPGTRFFDTLLTDRMGRLLDFGCPHGGWHT